MIRLFKHYVPYAVLLLGMLDALSLIVAGELGWVLRAWQIGIDAGPMSSRLPQILTFTAALSIFAIKIILPIVLLVWFIRWLRRPTPPASDLGTTE